MAGRNKWRDRCSVMKRSHSTESAKSFKNEGSRLLPVKLRRDAFRKHSSFENDKNTSHVKVKEENLVNPCTIKRAGPYLLGISLSFYVFLR